MGEHFQFRCVDCAYEAVVSGGPDFGMTVATQTIVCAKCKQLFDVMVSEDPGNPNARRTPLRCRRSRSAKHPVKPWKSGCPCPRCGGRMPRGQLLAMWD